MPKLHTQDHRSGAALVIAGILAIALPLCLLAGTMASQDSCQDLGSPPGLCSKAASHAGHLLAVPAPLITSLAEVRISEILCLATLPTTPSLGFLSTADGRAPPLS
jgi:hypothetical protein